MYLLYIAVGIGGAIGSMMRYAVTQLAAQTLGTGFPYGTWIVNALGSLCIGLLSVVLTRYAKDPSMAALLIAGLLGGFTTFSSFMNETMQYLLAGLWKEALGYLAVQLACGLVMVFAGVMIGRKLI